MKSVREWVKVADAAALKQDVNKAWEKPMFDDLFFAFRGQPNSFLEIGSVAEMTDAIALSVVYSHSRTQSHNVSDLLSRAAAKSVLADEAFMATTFAAAASHFTHNVKFSQADADVKRFVAEVTASTYGISSIDADNYKARYYGGGATRARLKHALLTEFVVDGARAPLLELLADSHPMALSALNRNLGVKKGTLAIWVEKASELCGTDLPTDAGRTQLLWASEGEYTSLSPVSSTRMHHSLSQAIHKFRETKEEFFVKYDHLLLGSGKPINIGEFSNTSNGRHPALMSGIPFIPAAETLADQVKEGRFLLRFANESVLQIAKPLTHFKGRDRYLRAANLYAEALLSDLAQYRGEIQANPELPMPRHGTLEYRLLTEKLSGSDLTRLCRTLADAVAARLSKKLTFNAKQFQFIQVALRDYLAGVE